MVDGEIIWSDPRLWVRIMLIYTDVNTAAPQPPALLHAVLWLFVSGTWCGAQSQTSLAATTLPCHGRRQEQKSRLHAASVEGPELSAALPVFSNREPWGAGVNS